MCYTFTAPFTISFITYMADISLVLLVSRVAFHDLTEHHVLPVEPIGCCNGDEEPATLPRHFFRSTNDQVVSVTQRNMCIRV